MRHVQVGLNLLESIGCEVSSKVDGVMNQTLTAQRVPHLYFDIYLINQGWVQNFTTSELQFLIVNLFWTKPAVSNGLRGNLWTSTGNLNFYMVLPCLPCFTMGCSLTSFPLNQPRGLASPASSLRHPVQIIHPLFENMENNGTIVLQRLCTKVLATAGLVGPGNGLVYRSPENRCVSQHFSHIHWHFFLGRDRCIDGRISSNFWTKPDFSRAFGNGYVGHVGLFGGCRVLPTCNG